MFLIATICDTRRHLEALRIAFDEIGLPHKLEVLDTDLGALCHFRHATELPDLVLVNGTLTVYEAPDFVLDLKNTIAVGRGRIAIMDPLEEDMDSLEELGVSLFLRKPISPATLKLILLSGTV